MEGEKVEESKKGVFLAQAKCLLATVTLKREKIESVTIREFAVPSNLQVHPSNFFFFTSRSVLSSTITFKTLTVGRVSKYVKGK